MDVLLDILLDFDLCALGSTDGDTLQILVVAGGKQRITGVCVCVCERERERVCVCVRVCDDDSGYVMVYVWCIL